MVSSIVFFVMGAILLYGDYSLLLKILGGIVAFISYICMHGAWNTRNKNNTEG